MKYAQDSKHQTAGPTPDAISDAILQARFHTGQTSQAFCNTVGISRASYNNWMSATAKPDFSTFLHIMNVSYAGGKRDKQDVVERVI